MKKKTVLIVYDDRIIRKQLENELKRDFFETFVAADGKTTLEIFGREEIDIVVLDVKLPDIDGLELLKDIKEKKPGCEVIVITGLGSQEIAISSLRGGAIDYIEKPIDPYKIIEEGKDEWDRTCFVSRNRKLVFKPVEDKKPKPGK